ncbi:MAG: pseudouridine-5'-phosphate glycosidase [Candidatus Rifleibacteriota bacterium]
MSCLKISKEVSEALKSGKPVVALESTIVSHGMPYPSNVETALLLENIVRENGGVPATIAIIEGKICVGLEKRQIEFLGSDRNIFKASRRDIPVFIANGSSAATTVSATMICAHLAGIKFFATGGIGGVHRGAEKTFDVSADLEEFARTPVLVVSAGAKAILDIPATVEYLETKGVPVIGYKTDEMPAFYYRNSGVKVPYKSQSTEEIARIFHQSIVMGYKSGILVGNPVPEEFALNRDVIEGKISEAIEEAKINDIKGQALTPFLLGKLYEITGGESLATNIELVKNNALVCTQIAKSFAELRP